MTAIRLPLRSRASRSPGVFNTVFLAPQPLTPEGVPAVTNEVKVEVSGFSAVSSLASLVWTRA